jgi:hypothetical protein
MIGYRIVILRTLALLIALLSLALPARAADKWSVGVNTMFIYEYALSLGLSCPNCPGNVNPHTLQQIQTTINNLVADQHVGTFREIVPFQLLSPNGTNDPSGSAMPADTTNYAVIDAVMDIFRANNVHLILALGNPVPAWAAPWTGGNGLNGCFLPPLSDTTDFYTLRANIAWTMANYVNHLQQNGYGGWMSGGPPAGGGLFLEGWNEWNTLANYQNCSDFSAQTPERAAELENGISWVVQNFYGITANLAAPSIVEAYKQLDGGSIGANYYQSYYAAGGLGAPNVHIYEWGETSYIPAYQDLQTRLHTLSAALPSQYQTKVILGETGFADGANCSGPETIDANDWAWYDDAIAQTVTGADANSTQTVQLLTVWRLDQLANYGDCQEATFGIISSDLTTYLPAAANMFSYLGGTGVYP